MTKTKSNNDLGRRARRKEQTRQQIFQAAMKLFEQKGIFSTTVEEITEAADVGKGTFFNYFPSKETILIAMAERQLSVIERYVEKAKDAPSVHPVLKGMIKELSTTPGRSQVMLRSLLGMVLSNKMLFEIFSAVLQKGRKMLAAIIERGQQIGEVRRDIPAIELARCLHQSALGTSFIWAISPPSDLLAWQERSLNLFWRGIAADPEPVLEPGDSKEEMAARHES
jgi:AcrR family transcriptional regulator